MSQKSTWAGPCLAATPTPCRPTMNRSCARARSGIESSLRRSALRARTASSGERTAEWSPRTVMERRTLPHGFASLTDELALIATSGVDEKRPMHQSRDLANEMSGSASLQMGGVAALYVLSLSTWLVIGPDAFGPARYNWDQTLIAAAAAFAAFKAAWQTARPYPPFLVMIGVGLLMLAASWATYNTNDALSLRFPGEGAPEYSDVAYAIFVFIWMCAWGY